MQGPKAIEFGPFRFDLEDRLLLRDGERIPLTPRATGVLYVLLEARGRVVSKREFLDRAWADVSVEESNLPFQIHLIKKVLGDGNGLRYIENLPRRGYRFVAPLREIGPDNHRGLVEGPSPVATRDAVQQEGELESGRAPVTRSSILTWRATLLVGAVCLVMVSAGFAMWDTVGEEPRIVSYTQLTHDGLVKGDNGLLLPAGANVYFSQGISHQLAFVSATGGETRPVPRELLGLEVLDISTIRSEYLAKRPADTGIPGDLWAAPLLAGPLRRLGSIVCELATWSPDGRQVAFVHHSDLFIASAGGDGVRKLASFVRPPDVPRWSPDSLRLRFAVSIPGDHELPRSLWEIRADGTDLHPLLPQQEDQQEQCCGQWTADGRYFVFEARRGQQSDIWMLSEGHGLFRKPSPIRLTAGPLSFFMPAPSADGRKLFALGVPVRGELVRLDRHLHAFVPFLDGISATWVSFSRDGQSLVYVTHPEGMLWASRGDGRYKRQLTFLPMDADGSSCSPDGKWVAFRGRTSSKRMKIFLVPFAGGQPVPITNGREEQGIPSWSPDGRRLTFGDVPEAFEHPMGTEKIRIYDIASRSVSTLPNSDGLWTSRWSPDGRYISALTIIGQKLRLFDVDTHRWRDTHADRVNNPNWSRDGQYIYYDTEGKTRALRRVSVWDGRVEELMNLDTTPPVAAYSWSGLAPDDSPLILRTAGSAEIYALELKTR